MTELIERLRGASDHTEVAPPINLDAIIRHGDRARRRRTVLPAVAAATGVAAAVVVGTVWWTPPTNRNAATLGGMAVMARPQAAQDELPAQVLARLPMDANDPSGELDLGSTRYLGSDGNARFYAARTDADYLCLVTTVPRSPYFASAGCSGADGFDAGGIETFSQLVGYKVLMVDDDGAPGTETSGMRRVATNLLVSDSAEGW